MDRYQQIAAGQTPQAEVPEKKKPTFNLVEIVIIIVISIFMDIISIADTLAFEVPIADIVATIFGFILVIWFTAKGIPSLRPLLRWAALYLLAWIPFVDYLFLYTIGSILAILATRSKTGTAIIKRVPGKGAVGRRAVANQTVGRAMRVEKRLERLEQIEQRVARAKTKTVAQLQKRLPGPLRNLPENGEWADQEIPGKGWSRLRAAKSALNSGGGSTPLPQPAGPENTEDPFPGTYEAFERELLPYLEDVLDVDVSGKRAVSAPPPKPAKPS